MSERKFSKKDELPFFFGIMTKEKEQEIRIKYPGQPRNLDYRREFIKGRGASTRDETWDRQKHTHTCCFSKVPWRHKAACENVLTEY